MSAATGPHATPVPATVPARAPAWRKRIADALAVVGPRVLYGLRMMGAVTLAMWIAFWLELQHAYWAPLTAAIVCQPTIGASLRKGQFRVIGTVTGAVVITVLTGAMPQSRIGLLAGLTAWAMLAGFCATLLRNGPAYAASLAGYTAVIVFTDAVGDDPVETFVLAVTRATEISIGVLCAGLVFAATDTGDARRRLARGFQGIMDGIAAGLGDILAVSADDQRERRRALIGRLVALDPLIDEALGETADLRYRSRTLHAGVEGMLRALSAWRAIVDHVESVVEATGSRETIRLPDEVRALARIRWSDDPAEARRTCVASARRGLAREVRTVSERLVADRVAEAMLGLGRAADTVALLIRPAEVAGDDRPGRIHVPDFMPALVNGARVGVAALVAAALWIELAWPGGQGSMVFACVVTILFAPQADRAYGIVRQFGLGVVFAAVAAGIAAFEVLPDQQSFLALNLTIAAVMVPAAAMAAGSWNKFFFTAITFIFLALLAPANQQTYDFASYLNQALGILVGILYALLAFRLVPPPASAWRTRRLLSLTLRDMRRLAAGGARGRRDWLGLIAARLGAMPENARPVDRARLIAGFAAGRSVLWLRGARLSSPATLHRALGGLAHGDVGGAVAGLEALEAAQSRGADGLRPRAEILLLRDVLRRHAPYFMDRPEAAGPGRGEAGGR